MKEQNLAGGEVEFVDNISEKVKSVKSEIAKVIIGQEENTLMVLCILEVNLMIRSLTEFSQI